MLRALRGEDGLVGLVGRWAGPSNPAGALVGHHPRRTVTDAEALVAALDDLPELGAPGSAEGPVAVGSGWFGFLGYQLGRSLERLAPPAVVPPGPPGRLGYYESVLRYDEADGIWWFEAVVEDGGEARMEARFARDVAAVAAAGDAPGEARPYALGGFVLEPGVEEHARAVAAVKEYIAAGDVFQVNACLHALAGFEGDPLDLFCTGLEALRPRYGAYVATDDGAVCSFSPELFLRVAGRSVLTSPIKGTVRRPADEAGAAAARATLLASAKDGAENAMIVDLMRNDLGRVCVPGSVRVAELARAEEHPGVWHLVSDVVGELAPGHGYADLVAATFPPGSITGAPKVRAMEIVNELEPVGRGAYTGAIGFVSPLGGLTLNVAIRTFEVAEGQARLGVGGGIVADSDVDGEVEECFTKARPLVEATGGRLERHAPAADLVALRPRPARGVFETMRAEDGRVAFAERHLARLAGSVEEVLGRALPGDVAGRVASLAACRPGARRLRVAVRPAGGSVRVEATLEELDERATAKIGLVPVALPGGLGRHKWLDRRLLGALRPDGLAPADQVLLVDEDGLVLEAERASVFAVVGGVLRTPGADQPILPGVARQWVLEEAERRRIPAKEGPLALGELADASEVFVTNALRGVERAGSVGTLVLGAPTPVADELEAALRKAWGRPRPAGEPPSPPPPAPWRAPSPAGAAAGGRGGTAGPVVVVDNFDSFTYNLIQALGELGRACVVLRSTGTRVEDVAGLDPAAIVLSPGPCSPTEAGICVDVVRRLSPAVPTLGVCLGHQCIAAAYGGSVVRAPAPVHGKTSVVDHDGSALFAGLPARFRAARYHSLVVDEGSLPAGLVVSARSGGIVMGVRHVEHPVVGVQFHPESFLTDHGMRLLANFLALARP